MSPVTCEARRAREGGRRRRHSTHTMWKQSSRWTCALILACAGLVGCSSDAVDASGTGGSGGAIGGAGGGSAGAAGKGGTEIDGGSRWCGRRRRGGWLGRVGYGRERGWWRRRWRGRRARGGPPAMVGAGAAMRAAAARRAASGGSGGAGRGRQRRRGRTRRDRAVAVRARRAAVRRAAAVRGGGAAGGAGQRRLAGAGEGLDRGRLDGREQRRQPLSDRLGRTVPDPVRHPASRSPTARSAGAACGRGSTTSRRSWTRPASACSTRTRAAIRPLQSRWQAMLNATSGMKAGDYLFIQFGINDSDPHLRSSRRRRRVQDVVRR